MVFDPATLVSYVSHVMTLLPGRRAAHRYPGRRRARSSTATWSPCRIEGIGSLTNRVPRWSGGRGGASDLVGLGRVR